MAIDKINSFKTIKEVNDYRQSINEACDNRVAFIESCKKASNLNEKSFGYIKESFESISPLLFKSNEGKSIIKKYIKVVRENKNLSSLHKLYENIRKANKETDIDFFVNNIANTDWNINKKTLAEDTKTLGRILSEGYLLLGKDADAVLPVENEKLSSAVSFIAENKKTSKNIAEYSSAIKIIRDNIEKNETVNNMFESVNLDGLAEKLISEFNMKYSDSLTIDEVNALKEISSCENRENVFNKYKEVCTNKISEAKENFKKNGDDAASKRLDAVLEQVSSKQYSLENVGSDICNLIELSNIFE